MVGMTLDPTPALDTFDLILDALGGEAAVAAECACGPSAISNWKRRGIPRARWYDLVTMAERLGKPLTMKDVEKADERIQREASAEQDAA